MIVRNVTRTDLVDAMLSASEQFDHNVTFNRSPEPINAKHTAFRLTLRVVDSRAPGARLSHNPYGNPRHMASACWHAHRSFMDALPPGAVVLSSAGKWSHGLCHNDPNVGSMMYPALLSELCECSQ